MGRPEPFPAEVREDMSLECENDVWLMADYDLRGSLMKRLPGLRPTGKSDPFSQCRVDGCAVRQLQTVIHSE
jgi:hypothetical protein